MGLNDRIDSPPPRSTISSGVARLPLGVFGRERSGHADRAISQWRLRRIAPPPPIRSHAGGMIDPSVAEKFRLRGVERRFFDFLARTPSAKPVRKMTDCHHPSDSSPVAWGRSPDSTPCMAMAFPCAEPAPFALTGNRAGEGQVGSRMTSRDFGNPSQCS